MNGARMRSYSLSGTPPEKISRSVPRLSALATARTRTSPVGRRRERLGADFGLAGRHIPERLRLFEARHLRLDLEPAARYILRGAEKHPMTERTLNIAATPPADPLTARRVFFTLVVLASMVGLIWLLSFALSAGGFGVVDFILVVLFAITLPWSVIGFWNATIGLFIMRSADPVAAVTPVSARVTRRRADHGEDRDPVVRAQRGHRARHPQHRADDGGDRRGRRRAAIPCLHSERHELSGDRRDRGAAFRRAEGEVAGAPRS